MTLTAHPSRALRGIAEVPGDKSISHRALMLGAVAEGETVIDGLLEADDVLRTAAALRAFGAEIERDGGAWRVRGGNWSAPGRTLYMGNAGTGARLLMGLAAGRQVPCSFTGDASLRARPMARITDPLVRMGAEAVTRGGQMPVSLAGGKLHGITYRLPKPSAQVKSAVLLAGLGAEGVTTVEEPVPTRDHTERMLRAFGADVGIEPMEAGLRVSVEGGQRLRACAVTVPADPSSAAFPIVAALIGDGAEVTIPGVMTNPRRTGLLDVLVSMGARFERQNERDVGGETVCDLVVRSSPLKAVHVSPEQVPDMVDEIPILAVAAAFAEGITLIEGLEELRVKESDRLAATLALLQANGVPCEGGEDWMKIEGGTVPGGGAVATLHDHRIAMSALVLGTAAHAPVSVDDASPIDTSFPSFRALMEGLGAQIEG